jgi:hypothetical protein
MKVTLKVDGKTFTVSAPRGFELLVDDELLLAHAGGGDAGYQDVGYGEEPGYEQVKALYAAEPAKKCCYGTCHGTSSLFEHAKAEADKDGKYINFAVPNSSFIETIRWWSYEKALGENSLEVHFKDGNYACYADVPEYIIQQWIEDIKAGRSAGKFYNWNIKDAYESIMES